MNESKAPYVVGIGAANADLYAKSSIPMRPQFDHPSHITTNIGGVTRGILSNLAKLDVKTALLGAVGDDLYGQMILRESANYGIDISRVMVQAGQSSGIFMQIQDGGNDMSLAFCDMSVIEGVDIAYLEKNADLLRGSKAIVFDPSLPDETLAYLLDTYRGCALFADPLSALYAEKLRPYLNRIFAIKPNRSELAALSGRRVETVEEVADACRSLIDCGVQRVYASLGGDGCCYTDSERTLLRKGRKVAKIVNASGAGDSFYAGVIYAYLHDLDTERALDYGMAAGAMAVMHENTVNPALSVAALERMLAEN